MQCPGDTGCQSTAVFDNYDNATVTGCYRETINFGDGDLPSTGQRDIFVVKFDETMALQWSRRYGDAEEQYVLDVAVDSGNNIIIVGSFQGRLTIGVDQLDTAGGADIFVAKLDSAGNPLWAQAFGDATEPQRAESVFVDSQGDIWVTGLFSGSVNFGDQTLVANTNADVFLAKLSTAGDVIWSARYGDGAAGSYEKAGRAVVVDSTGVVSLGGTFDGPLQFGDGPSLLGLGAMDVFLGRCFP